MRGKRSGAQQVQNVLGVAGVGFLVADFARPNARRVAHPQLVPQLSHQPLEPIGGKRRFNPHHRPPRKLQVELLHFLALVLQPPLLDLSRLLVDPRHKLVARVHVTSDKMLHGFGSFPGSPWSRTNQVYRTGADAVIQSDS